MTMTGTQALVWFITTTVLVFGMIGLGVFLAVHSYDRGRGEIHLRPIHLRPIHLRHRHD
jgi:hypothetical protein